LLARVNRHRVLAGGLAAVVLAASVTVPLVLTDDGEPFWQPPAATRALADEPAAATRALDPGDDLDHLSAARRLLVHENVCDDGARVLGRVVTAATRATSPGAAHTMAQARSAFAVAEAFDDRVPPAPGLAPALARMLADYEADTVRDFRMLGLDEARGPAATPAAEARHNPVGGLWIGSLAAPNDAHALFRYDRAVSVEWLVRELAASPEAFAVLHDSARAYFAHYLERLTSAGAAPEGPGTDHDADAGDPMERANDTLRDIGAAFGQLMGYRTLHAQKGTIGDLAEFDRAVRAHIHGTYRPAAYQVTTRPPMGAIAARSAGAPLRGDLMDGRHQLITVLEEWAGQRHVPEQRLTTIRQLIDSGYVRGAWKALI